MSDTTYSAKITYTATYEQEIVAPTRSIALFMAGQAMEADGIAEQLQSYGMVINIKQTVVKKENADG